MKQPVILVVLSLIITFQEISAQAPKATIYDSDSLLNQIIQRKGSLYEDCDWVRNILFVDHSAVAKLTAENITKDCYQDILKDFKSIYGNPVSQKPYNEIPVQATISGFRDLVQNVQLFRDYILRPIAAGPEDQIEELYFIVKNDIRAYFEITGATWAVGYIATLIGKQTLRFDQVMWEDWIPDLNPPKSDTGADDVFLVVEELPEFPGGEKGRSDWLKEHIVKQGLSPSRNVFISFIIEKDGTQSGFRILRGDTPEHDSAIIRVMKKMPEWKPGKYEGTVVRVRYTIKVEGKM